MSSKLFILTAAVNNPLFIEIQNRSFRKYVKLDFEFIVFNDAKKFPDFSNFKDTSIRDKITLKCYELGVKCIEVPNDHHTNLNASQRTANMMDNMTAFMKRQPARYMIIDSDMFLISDFNGFDESVAIVPQIRSSRDGKETICYAWNGFFWIDTRRESVEGLRWSVESGTTVETDTGGASYEWLKNRNAKRISTLSSGAWTQNEYPSGLDRRYLIVMRNDPRNENGKFFMEIYDNRFWHYRCGGNWRQESREMHETLSDMILSCFKQPSPFL